MNRTVKRFLCSALILAMLVTAALPCFAAIPMWRRLKNQPK